MTFQNTILTLTCLALLGLGYLADRVLDTRSSPPSIQTQVLPREREQRAPRGRKPSPTPEPDKLIEVRSIRNPFEPGTSPSSRSSMPRLEQLDLSDLHLVAIVKDMEGKLAASVEDPHGIGFFVRPGTRIGNRGHVVQEISEDGITLETPESRLEPPQLRHAARFLLRVPAEK